MIEISLVLTNGRHIYYKHALKTLDMKTLKVRRSELCLTFAKKALKSEKFANWFSINDNNYDKTRSDKTVLNVVKTRTDKYMKSPVPYLTNILNDHLMRRDKK